MTETRSNGWDRILLKVQNDLHRQQDRSAAKKGQITEEELLEMLRGTGLQGKLQTVLREMSQTYTIETAMALLAALHANTDRLYSYNIERDPETSWANLPTRKTPVQDLTPGQEHWQRWLLQIIFNTHNPRNRPVLKENFGVEMPLISDRKNVIPPEKPVQVTNVGHLTVLPRINRLHPQLVALQATDKDATKGITSPLQRGQISSKIRLSLQPAPVSTKAMMLHDRSECRFPTLSMNDKPADVHKSKPPQTGIRQHHSGDNTPRLPPLTVRRPISGKPRTCRLTPLTPPSSQRKPKSRSQRPACEPTPAEPEPVQPTEPHILSSVVQPCPSLPTSDLFAIRHGKVCSTEPEFVSFKRHNSQGWTSHMNIIHHLETLLIDYAVPVAYIKGTSLVELSRRYDTYGEEKAPKQNELLKVIFNRQEVEDIISTPGRRFLGPKGPHLAAVVIQTVWRGYIERVSYRQYQYLKQAVDVISVWWLSCIKRELIRQKLKETRARQLENFRLRAKRLAESWSSIKASKRVVIHLPSLGILPEIRHHIRRMDMRQNTQMARLCEIRDPNVDVIFISPVPIKGEVLQYYATLLGLSGCIQSGCVEDRCDLSDRYVILVPEAIERLSCPSMSLSTLLKYSPHTLKRISELISGRIAYIVPGVPHQDDLAVADALDVPVLCPEPDVASLYSSKSGCKKLFSCATEDVDLPPSACDIYSPEQLYRSLTRLVINNLHIDRWLLKIDDEIDGRGVAYCDVTTHLQCFRLVKKEAKRFGKDWNNTWAQESAYNQVLEEIPGILKNHTKTGPTYMYWKLFLVNFVQHGGVIEACPKAHGVNVLTASWLIEPDGAFNLIMTGDQIHAESPYRRWGLSVPQTSVEPLVLNKVLKSVSAACYTVGIFGYVQMDLVTYVDPNKLDQQLWAVDLRTQYTDSMAMFQLSCYLTRGQFCPRDHTFTIPYPASSHLSNETREESAARFCVMSTHLYHTNLTILQLKTFFALCRSQGIGFDVKQRNGTIFTFIDYVSPERLGMLTLNSTLQEALCTFARNLSVIHQEISTANMQGTSNFKGAIEDIQKIACRAIRHADKIRMQRGKDKGELKSTSSHIYS